MTTSENKAFEIGRQAANIATAEIDDFRSNGAGMLMSGFCLVAAKGREDLIDRINAHIHELSQDPDVFYKEKLQEQQDAAEENDAQVSDDLYEAVNACRDWLRALKVCMAEQPKQVRAGIEAWVNEYAADHDLDPDSLSAR